MNAIRVFLDCADKASILKYIRHPRVQGVTTNPTLIRTAGIRDYRRYVDWLSRTIPEVPVSLAVPSRDREGICREALEISTWHPIAYVKVPVISPSGETLAPVISDLTSSGCRINVTAMFTKEHVRKALESCNREVPIILSIFAGRIADTGCDPVKAVREAVELAADYPLAEILWASPREIYNLKQAEEAGSHIITLPPLLIDKLTGINQDLETLARNTVEEFCRAAEAMGLKVLSNSAHSISPMLIIYIKEPWG
jgi:transaldolase